MWDNPNKTNQMGEELATKIILTHIDPSWKCLNIAMPSIEIVERVYAMYNLYIQLNILHLLVERYDNSKRPPLYSSIIHIKYTPNILFPQVILDTTLFLVPLERFCFVA